MGRNKSYLNKFILRFNFKSFRIQSSKTKEKMNLFRIFYSCTSSNLNLWWFKNDFNLQAERFVDRKLDQADSALRKQQKKAKKWYHSLIGDENGVKLNELHIFLCAFTGGVAIGVASG